MGEINFIKYQPDKDLDPLFERFLLWASHILPYNKEEIIKKCSALQKIRNKFRENYTEAKNGLIDVLNKMNSSLMKLLNDEQLIIIFNKQLKQLSKINKVKFEQIEDYDELYKKNHELYDNLPEYQKEKFLYGNLNKEILKYFGLYKSIKERKINNAIDDRLREYNIIKDKDLKRKKEIAEKEDKVMQELKKAKGEQATGQTVIIDNPLKNSYFISLRDNLSAALRLEEAANALSHIDNLGTRNKGWVNEFIQLLAKLPDFINAGQTNINNLDDNTLKKMAKRLPLLIGYIEKLKKSYIDEPEPVEPPKTGAKKGAKTEAKEKDKEAAKVEVKEEVKPTGELVKTEVKEKFIDPKKAKQYKKEKFETIKSKLTKADKKIFASVSSKGKEIAKSISDKIKTRIKANWPDIEDNDCGTLLKYYRDHFNELPDGPQATTQPSEQAAPQPVAQSDPQPIPTVETITDGVENIDLNKDTEQPQPEQQQSEDKIPGYGLLGTIIKGIGSIFGLGSNVLSDKVIKELLQYQNQKDGNKIIDAIIIWELMHNHKNIPKAKYPEIIKEFDKKHRPKLFYVRNKFKKYNNTDKFLGGFPFGILAGLIPSALQGVSSIISAIKGNSCSSLRSKKTSNYKGGKALSLQELNNIKNSIK